MPKYYPINEEAAKRAKDMNSFSDYQPDVYKRQDLITFSKDAAELLADLQSRNERMFLLTFTVVNLASNRQRLENDVFRVFKRIQGISQRRGWTRRCQSYD